MTSPFDSHHLWLADTFLLFITHDEVRFVLFRPVFIGRSVMKLWMGDASVHELYTAACGLYFIWLVCRLGSVLFSWVPLGWGGVALKLFEWFVLVTYLLPLCVLCSPSQFLFLKLEKGKRETLQKRGWLQSTSTTPRISLKALLHWTTFLPTCLTILLQQEFSHCATNCKTNVTLRNDWKPFLQHFRAPRSRTEFPFSWQSSSDNWNFPYKRAFCAD